MAEYILDRSVGKTVHLYMGNKDAKILSDIQTRQLAGLLSCLSSPRPYFISEFTVSSRCKIGHIPGNPSLMGKRVGSTIRT